jgi:tetratricopeptide (TPR) repeat protein
MELGHRLTVEALARTGAEVRNHLRCKGLFDAGQLRYHMGQYAGARESLEESLAIARELADKRAVAAVLQPLGMAALAQGQLVIAGGYLEEAVSLAKERDNKRELAAAYTALAQLRRVEGKPEAAMPIYEQVLHLARELDDRESVAIALLDLIMVATTPDPVRAKAMLFEALDIAVELGSTRVQHATLDVCAGLAAEGGDWEAAARFFGAAEAQAARTALRRDPADEAYLMPRIAAARQGGGDQSFAAAESSGRALSHDDAISEARAWLTSR